jgi:hypothetical protein
LIQNRKDKINKIKKIKDNMKILKRGDDFRKVPEVTINDVLIIRNLISQGWNYCSKQIYKDAMKNDTPETKETKKSKNVKDKK